MGGTKYAGVVKAVNAIADALIFIKTVDDFIDSHDPNEPILISFGTFELGGDVRKPGGAKNSTPIASGAATGATKTANSKANNVTSKLGTTSGSFRFPLLSDPKMAFGLLTGKDVTLFIYDLPKLDLDFEYIKSFPIFPGLNARFGGIVKATTNFSFGFDTHGINGGKKDGTRPPAMAMGGISILAGPTLSRTASSLTTTSSAAWISPSLLYRRASLQVHPLV